MNAFLEENSLTGTCSIRSAVVETKATVAGIIANGGFSDKNSNGDVK